MRRIHPPALSGDADHVERPGLCRATQQTVHDISSTRKLITAGPRRGRRTRIRPHQVAGPARRIVGAGGIQRRQEIVVVAEILRESHPQLFEIVDADGSPGLVARLVQRGQQHGSKNGNDSNHYQKLNQREFYIHWEHMAIRHGAPVQSGNHRFDFETVVIQSHFILLAHG